MPLTIRALPLRLAVTRLDPREAIPPKVTRSGFFSVTRTAEELSIVCEEVHTSAGARVEGGWRALALVGPFAFDQVGILASIARPLADAAVPIFAISTFDTDYVLVKEEHVSAAVAALRAVGHEVREDGDS
ncbi:MAG: ACT domain-containing protein [Bryobacteraceae bacterium]|nr:ACT domain-containing protein [Bryobacteraceae bacterium]